MKNFDFICGFLGLEFNGASFIPREFLPERKQPLLKETKKINSKPFNFFGSEKRRSIMKIESKGNFCSPHKILMQMGLI